MERKPITEIIENIKSILEKNKELSIRQISLKTKSQWRTIEKALNTMRNLGVVNERVNKSEGRVERLFSLKK